MVVDTERRTGSAVHGHMARLVDALGHADDQGSRAVRYELARVIDEHLFDVHRRVNRAPSDAVVDPTPTVEALRAALRAVCLGEPAGAVLGQLDVHERSCPID